MNSLDLARLEALTQDYATFQARKSGLATTLGGVLVLLMFLFYCLMVPLASMSQRIHPPWALMRVLCGMIFLVPLLWGALHPFMGRRLYGSLGWVKEKPDALLERNRWRWIFGIVIFLLLFQTAALLGFVQELLGQAFVSRPAPATLAANWRPWLWVGTIPLLYALMAPWCVRGAEEARAYAVLVGQGTLWIVVGFSYDGVNHSAGSERFWVPLCMILQGWILVWAFRAIRRGWLEHRDFRALVEGLPQGLVD